MSQDGEMRVRIPSVSLPDRQNGQASLGIFFEPADAGNQMSNSFDPSTSTKKVSAIFRWQSRTGTRACQHTLTVPAGEKWEAWLERFVDDAEDLGLELGVDEVQIAFRMDGRLGLTPLDYIRHWVSGPVFGLRTVPIYPFC